MKRQLHSSIFRSLIALDVCTMLACNYAMETRTTEFYDNSRKLLITLFDNAQLHSKMD